MSTSLCVNCPFVACPFSNWIASLLLIYGSSLYMKLSQSFEWNVYSDPWIDFSCQIVFDEQALNFDDIKFIHFFMTTLCHSLKNICLLQSHGAVFSRFSSSRRFIVVPFSSSSRMRLEWVRVCVVREGLKLCCQLVPLLCVEEGCPLSAELPWCLSWLYMCESISTPLICLSIFCTIITKS